VYFIFLRERDKIGKKKREKPMFDESDPKWNKLVVEITSGIKEWVEQNPKATMAEIERETMRRMSELQARMLEDILRAKAAEEKVEGRESVLCPECGAEMVNRGERKKRLQAQGG
jgi:hypothetical protein